jgi:hypothetical protein
MAVVLTTVSLCCTLVSSVVNVIDRIPMEYFFTNTCAGQPDHDQQHCYHQATTVNQRLLLYLL